PAFARGLMAESWLLSDRSIGRAWRRVHRLASLDEGTVPVAELGPGESEAVVRLIAGSGMPNRDKVDVLVRLLDDTGPATRRAVFWALVDNRDEAATGVLQGIACRRDDPLAAAAARDVRRRRPGDRPIVSDSIDAHARRSGDRPWDFEAIWQGLDEWDEAACEAARQGIEGAQGDLTVPLRVKMASLDAGDRLKALRLIRMWRLTPALAERIYRLCNDGDAMVRSLAVGMLADLEGPTARRILRRAVDDPDARVQANAIEAFEAVHLPDREGPLTEKLRSPHHRVRATAVAALLRMQLPEAGETLLDMLESPQQPQRISALWVIERLNLVSLMHRLIAMADHDPDVQVRRRAARVLETIPAWTGLEANDRSPVTVEGAP
ncbi:MAG: HEAT repeat domain-containing protein, partial [bacterium]|nr:HEAT repeat domain-containing protein [bacterium]